MIYLKRILALIILLVFILIVAALILPWSFICLLLVTIQSVYTFIKDGVFLDDDVVSEKWVVVKLCDFTADIIRKFWDIFDNLAKKKE